MGVNKAISLKTLMSKSVFRSHVLDIEGLGAVELVEISQAEALLIQSEMADTDKEDGEANLSFMTRWALRMMEGRMPTDDEIKKVRENCSADFIAEVFKGGMNYNGQKADSKEGIEKN